MNEIVLLPYTPERTTPQDIQAISERLAVRRPTAELRAFDWENYAVWVPGSFPAKTVMVTLNNDAEKPSYRDIPGPKFFAPDLDKNDLVLALKASAIPMPHTEVWDGQSIPTEDDFGAYVAIKTGVPGTVRGQGIFVCRTDAFQKHHRFLFRRFRKQLSAGYPPVLQQYIQTGPKPCHTRVSTFLGAPIVCFQTVAPKVFTLPDATTLAHGDATSNASSMRSRTLVDDPELVALSAEVSKVFPTTCVLGIDMVRCVETGKTYCIEANLGNLGVLSSHIVGGLRQSLGEEAMHAQFGSYDTIARRICEVLDEIPVS